MPPPPHSPFKTCLSCLRCKKIKRKCVRPHGNLEPCERCSLSAQPVECVNVESFQGQRNDMELMLESSSGSIENSAPEKTRRNVKWSTAEFAEGEGKDQFGPMAMAGHPSASVSLEQSVPVKTSSHVSLVLSCAQPTAHSNTDHASHHGFDIENFVSVGDDIESTFRTHPRASYSSGQRMIFEVARNNNDLISSVIVQRVAPNPHSKAVGFIQCTQMKPRAFARGCAGALIASMYHVWPRSGIGECP
mmetsp:Transcript_2927/g.6335  ORF Transcript_2927/g.6335 Transcript_2927/m.6335 type:complete len:247 (+) Transcript_2927:140-880(+)